MHYCGWDMHIWVPARLKGSLSGLCGNNDGYGANDFTDRRGNVVGKYAFAESWEVR